MSENISVAPSVRLRKQLLQPGCRKQDTVAEGGIGAETVPCVRINHKPGRPLVVALKYTWEVNVVNPS